MSEFSRGSFETQTERDDAHSYLIKRAKRKFFEAEFAGLVIDASPYDAACFASGKELMIIGCYREDRSVTILLPRPSEHGPEIVVYKRGENKGVMTRYDVGPPPEALVDLEKRADAHTATTGVFESLYAFHGVLSMGEAQNQGLDGFPITAEEALRVAGVVDDAQLFGFGL